jgi:uncharacterized protein involved in exopolysaccharide biosynthesis
MPNVYTANALILMPQEQPLSAMFGGAAGGALAQLSGGMNPLKNPNDLYVGMLRSRNVLDGVIAAEHYKKDKDKSTDDVRDRLSSATKLVAGKDNMISIEVTDRNPELAARLANAYVDNLRRLTAEVGVSTAQARRKYLKGQTDAVKAALTEAEDALKEVQEKTGITEISLNAQADVGSAAALDARIAGKEGEIASLRQFSTDRNADVQRALSELASLKAGAAGLKQPALSGLAANGLKFVRAYRAVKYQETLYEVLSRQYEMARIDETKQVSSLEVVDPAAVPDLKSGPKRTLITMFGFFLSLFVALTAVAVREGSFPVEHS